MNRIPFFHQEGQNPRKGCYRFFAHLRATATRHTPPRNARAHMQAFSASQHHLPRTAANRSRRHNRPLHCRSAAPPPPALPLRTALPSLLLVTPPSPVVNMAFTRSSQQQDEQAKQNRQDDDLAIIKKSLPPTFTAATIHLSDQIEILNKLKKKGRKYKARLATTTGLLDIMMRCGTEGYERFKKEGNYRWALDVSKGTGNDGGDDGPTDSAAPEKQAGKPTGFGSRTGAGKGATAKSKGGEKGTGNDEEDDGPTDSARPEKQARKSKGRSSRTGAGRGATAKRGKKKPATPPAAKKPDSHCRFSLAESDASAAASPAKKRPARKRSSPSLSDSDASADSPPKKGRDRKRPSAKTAPKKKKKKSKEQVAMDNYTEAVALASNNKEVVDDRRGECYDRPYPGQIPDAFVEFRVPVHRVPLCIYDINGTVHKYEKKHIRSAIFNEPAKMWSISRPPKGASSVHSPDQVVIPFRSPCWDLHVLLPHPPHSIAFCSSCEQILHISHVELFLAKSSHEPV